MELLQQQVYAISMSPSHASCENNSGMLTCMAGTAI